MGSIYPGIPRAFGKTSDELWDQKRSLQYLLWKDPNWYLPRAAFEGYLAKLKSIIRKFKIKRVDYIFHAQTPSDRPVGGAAAIKLKPVKTGKDIYETTINTDNPWTLEKITEKIQNLMK